uniref:Uncharacterized protein n=1 Tax=Setaria italica TaxID=4555 RepID=K3Z1X4_SETIT
MFCSFIKVLQKGRILTIGQTSSQCQLYVDTRVTGNVC